MKAISRYGAAKVAALLACLILPASAGADPAIHDRSWMLEHLGAAGLEKCRAFRKVRQDAEQLQAVDHGTLSRQERRRLEAELAAVKRRAPKAVTPSSCGSF
jgi:hypothetical protein